MKTLGQVLLLLIATCATAAFADLPRQTHLGLQFDLTDKRGPGLLVSGVLPKSTAELAGLRPGDRLTSVGSIDDLEVFAELREELARTPAGSRILLRWYRGRVVRRVRPPLGVLPMEVVPESAVRYSSVSVDGIRQRLILSEPLEETAAVVFYLQDMDCASLDFWLDTDNTIKQLIDGWAEAGFATARLEKRGVGDSEGDDCGGLSFEDELKGYRAAVDRLAELGFSRRVFLFGHGLGGLMAPQLIGDDVLGVMVYGTVGVPWFDHAMAGYERQDRLKGLTQSEIEARRTVREKFQQGLLFEGATPSEMIARLPEAAVLEGLSPGASDRYRGRSVQFFEQLAAIDPERLWRRVWQPVLAVHGDFDWVSARTDHERIAGFSGGKFLAIAGLDHRFLSYHSLEQSFVSGGTGVFDPAIVEATVTWMRANATFAESEN
jgi:pimeloyl-ACP methyl ester carboxylesterase